MTMSIMRSWISNGRSPMKFALGSVIDIEAEIEIGFKCQQNSNGGGFNKVEGR